MEFKIRKGPWNPIFEGTFQGHAMEILQNPESMLLVIVYDEEKGKKQGAVIESFVVFHAKGEIETLAEKTKSNSVALIRHADNTEFKFFLLGENPKYVAYKEDDVHKETDHLIEQLEKRARLVKKMAEAMDVSLSELADSSEAVQKAFFSQPLSLAALYTAQGETTKPSFEETAHAETPSTGTVLLGLDNNNQPIKEPVSLFEKTLVDSGNEDDRMKILRVLVESAIISKAVTVIFDTGNHFSGLNAPTQNASELQKFGFGFEPAGFPVKKFYPAKEIFADISLLDANGLSDLIGLGEQKTRSALHQVLSKKMNGSLSDIARQIQTEKQFEGIHEYEKQRVSRILRLVDIRHEGLFNGQNNIEEILKFWIRGLGKASVIDLSGREDKEIVFIAHSVVAGIAETLSEKTKSRQLSAVIVFSNAEKVFSASRKNNLTEKVIENLENFKSAGIGFFAATEKVSEIDERIAKLAEATITVIRGEDVGVQLKGKRNYRARIRPPLSSL